MLFAIPALMYYPGGSNDRRHVLVRHGFWVLRLFFFQAEDGIRALVRSRGLGEVYKRQTSRQRGECSTKWATGTLVG